MDKEITIPDAKEIQRRILEYIDAFWTVLPGQMSSMLQQESEKLASSKKGLNKSADANYLAAHNYFKSTFQELIKNKYIEKINIEPSIHTYLSNEQWPFMAYALTDIGEAHLKDLNMPDGIDERA